MPESLYNMPTHEWYDTIARIYDELYGEEQKKKIKVIEETYYRLFGDKIFERGLDFGCGTGISTEFLVKICKEVWACDISEEMLKIARQKVNAIFVKPEEIYNKEKYFDIILSVTVLQDIKEKEEILKMFGKVLKEDGVIILSVLKRPGIAFWKPLIKKYFNIIWFVEEEKDLIFFLTHKF